jgi:hypothetical protein
MRLDMLMLALAFFFIFSFRFFFIYDILFVCLCVDVFICETVCIAAALAGNVHFANRIEILILEI